MQLRRIGSACACSSCHAVHTIQTSRDGAVRLRPSTILMAHPPASLSGTLSSRPLFQVLVHLLELGATGTLVVEDPRGSKSALFFGEGVPMRCHLPGYDADLSVVLNDLGLIDEATVACSPSPGSARGPKTPAPEELGASIDAEALERAAKELLTRQVVELGRLPRQSVWGFYSEQRFIGGEGEPGSASPEPLGVIWRVVQAYTPLSSISQAVAKLGDPVLRLHRSAQVARFGFVAPEKALVDVLRAKPHQLSQLIQTKLAAPEVVERLVYTLLLTRHLDAGGGKEPLGVSATRLAARLRESVPSTRFRPRPRLHTPGGEAILEEPSANVAPTPITEQSEFRQRLQQKLDSLSTADYYRLLGVAPTTSSDDIQNAFLGMVKVWHPDRLRPELAELRPQVERLFARITEAHQTLVDEVRRKRYDELLDEGGGTVEEQEQIQAVIRAATAYQKAEVYLRKRAVEEAESEAKRALDNDPEQADYQALYAWILAQKNPLPRPLSALIETLDAAVERSPKSVRNRFFRAQLLKRAGEDQRAIADFQWIVEQDRHHVDARRELRIYEMRGSIHPHQKGKSGAGKVSGSVKSPPASGKGLLGKLFKR